MPTTIDDLANAIQGFFASKFPASGSGGPGSVVLVLDQLGTPLDAVEFTGSGTGAATDLLSHQRAAQLADQIPAANALASGWYLPRSGSRLSRWYQQVVSASSSSSPDPSTFQAFVVLKQAARELFDNARLNVVSGTGVGGAVDPSGVIDNYYATTMSPIDWFEDAATCWADYQVASADNPPPTPAPSPIPRPRFWLRVGDGETTGPLASYVQRATITTLPADTLRAAEVQPDVVASASTTETSPDAASPDMATQPASPVFRRAFSARALSTALHPSLVSHAAFAENLDVGTSVRDAPLSVDTAAETPAAPAKPVFVGARLFRPDLTAVDVASTSETTPAPASDSGVATAAPLRQIIAFPVNLDLTAVVGATTEKPPTSNNFHVSFEYCKVTFDRPWWDDVFVDSHGWTVFGYDPGSISSGSAATPSGEVTLLTIGMILVRNLSISANWSSDDLAALPNTTSLGPFCIAGASFDQNSGTLTRDGVQAVAWLCQVPPILPPAVTTSGTGSSATNGSGDSADSTDGGATGSAGGDSTTGDGSGDAGDAATTPANGDGAAPVAHAQ